MKPSKSFPVRTRDSLARRSLLGATACLVTVAGCTRSDVVHVRPTPVASASPSTTLRFVSSADEHASTPTPSTAPAAAPVALPSRDPIAVALHAYRERDVPPPVIPVGTAVAYPFGHGTPTLTCAVLRACVIELAPGESLVSEPIAGDQARWIIRTARSGVGGRDVLVVVKPRACDIGTNLVLSTEARLYDVTLEAPCATTSTGARRGATIARTGATPITVRHLRFYYPDDDEPAGSDGGRVWAARTAVAVRRTADSVSTALNRDYAIVRERRGPFGAFGRRPVDFPWQPRALYDDGAHVFVVLPAAARHQAAPVLYALEEDASRTLVNYATRGDTLVTDRPFRRGVLVLSSGDAERRLVFENRAWDAARPAPAAPPRVAGRPGSGRRDGR